MGRLSTIYKKLTKERVSEDVLNKQDVQKYMRVSEKLLESILKSRGKRRQAYVEQLRNCHAHFAVAMSQSKL